MPSRPSPIRWTPADALEDRQRSSGRLRAIWAQHDTDHVLVFQAFRPAIGLAAAAAGTLAVSGFSMDRTTWIKPGFLWMMHRSDWGRSEGQEVVLGIHVSRAWFEEALGQAELSRQSEGERGPAKKPGAPVVVQWDPDWSAGDERQPWRAIQIGLRAAAVDKYLSAITGCGDLSERVAHAREQREHHAQPMVPDADVLDIADLATRQRLGIDSR